MIDTDGEGGCLISFSADDGSDYYVLPRRSGRRFHTCVVEHKLGRVAESREHTLPALKESESVGDSEGVRIYAANLKAIDGSWSRWHSF